MSELDLAKRILAQRLESLSRAGVTQIGKVPPPAVAAPFAPRGTGQPVRSLSTAPPQEPEMPRAKAAPDPLQVASRLKEPYPASVASQEQRCQLLEALNQEVKGCRLCAELARFRTQTVFGVGNVRPRVVFFGEAPGADEDRTGEPFVGRAGQLLTKIIEACTWKREDVYILNTLKCRPPDNRTPDPAEVAHCRPFWERQLEILQPEYIVCAGSVAAQTLLESTEAVGKMRGRFYAYRGSKVLVTYHPSYLLRNPPAKKFVWEDMQMLMAAMGVELPKKTEG